MIMNSLTGARLHLRLELKFINKVISAIDCLFCTNKTQNHFHPNNHSCLAVCLSRKLIGVGIVPPPDIFDQNNISNTIEE